MSIIVRFPPSNVSKEQYDTVRSALEAAGNWPADGCELHVCFGDPQDIRVSEAWASQEKFEAFGETLRPHLEAAGIQIAGEPEVYEAHIVETF
jgi:sugar phosphate isomerase/epimerase